MSDKHNNGNTIPVDDLLPNTNAISVTLSISMPFNPAFPSPMKKDASKMINQVEKG